MKTLGIHHISLISRHGQEIIDFYSGFLGLKLVKKTLNYENNQQYHLYFGTDSAEVGSLLTFFPHPLAKQGLKGDGQVRTITLAIPKNSFSFWENRLRKFEIEYAYTRRFKQTYLSFNDLDNIEIELTETDLGNPNLYEFNGVTKEVAIKGIYGVILNAGNPESENMLKELGYQKTDESSLFDRFKVNDQLGGLVDLYKIREELGIQSIGTVHHIAYAVNDDEINLWHEKLIKEGFKVTEVKDRKYFKSIYFKEQSGITYELATQTPGMLIDESIDQLGKNFIIPEQFTNLDKNQLNQLMPLFIKENQKLTKYDYIDKKSFDEINRHKVVLQEINKLARIAKERELTPDEFKLRKELREEYVSSITRGVRNMIEKVQVVDKDGNVENSFVKKEKEVN
ncbi:Glyoxalase domain protein [Alteracholeplasma palmae J233]|uniref:Glyoxalase domain protein n=1 Tax=Alteracholeplasma palmae (strain ATCC 49389 / J233) TaxID=1318466 RepID=U4KKX7_ALTPJ|nr:DUF896 domain-containing protein [Alteracholeplasma palmae]CCV64367.1 Glyoxalase domain protein [Alteracholeplasma palmae J233]